MLRRPEQGFRQVDPPRVALEGKTERFFLRPVRPDFSGEAREAADGAQSQIDPRQVRRDLKSRDIVRRDVLQPDAPPDPAGGGVPHAAPFLPLFAVGQIDRQGVGGPDPQHVFPLPVEVGGYVELEGEIAPPMAP